MDDGEVKWNRIKRDLMHAKTNLPKKVRKESKQYEDVATFGIPEAPKPFELLRLKTEVTRLNEVMSGYLVVIDIAIVDATNILREETFPPGKENMTGQKLLLT